MTLTDIKVDQDGRRPFPFGISLLLVLAFGFVFLSGDASARQTVQSDRSANSNSSPAVPFATTTATVTATQTPDPCASGWAIVTTSELSPNGHYLKGVEAIAADNVWAVGYYYDADAVARTLILQWNGTEWDAVPSPNAEGDNFLYGVEAIASDDIWAVGSYCCNNQGLKRTLALHWDGAVWSVISMPDTGNGDNVLSAISAVSPADVWSVGYQYVQGFARTLIEHWDGNAWSVIPGPNVGDGTNKLQGVAAISAGSVWAVGSYCCDGTRWRTLALHWNGTQWSIVSTPDIGSDQAYLYAVDAVSESDIWAVGSGPVGQGQTLTMHWNGQAWNVVASPNPGTQVNYLYGVAAASTNDVWAVGYSSTSGYSDSLIEHWDGMDWSVVPSPNIEPYANRLYGVSTLSASDAWAMGDFIEPATFSFRALTQHFTMPCSTPTPTRTGTPPTATRTRTATRTNTIGTVSTSTPTSAPASATTTASPTPIEPCGLAWRNVDSSSQGSGGATLQGVAALSPTDIWAVGYSGSYVSSRTFTVHWNGTRWSTVPSPNMGLRRNVLFSVAAISSTDVWAVGLFDFNANKNRTFILHWDGARWNVVPSPNPGEDNGLHSVAARDGAVWAVGNFSTYPNPTSTLIMNWTGSQWNVIPSPNPGPYAATLNGVSIASPSDVWAVGLFGSRDESYQTLTMHWDGVQWSVVPSPVYMPYDNNLLSVHAIAADDVWAVGYADEGTDPLNLVIAQHWDGQEWTRSPMPVFGQFEQYLYSVTGDSSNDVWAMGWYHDVHDASRGSIIMHWDGTRWDFAPSESQSGILYSGAMLSSTDVWAVGSTYDNVLDSQRTMVMHYSEPCGPTPTGTPPTATATPLSACDVNFADVPEDHAFYSFIKCLVCRSIVSGYDDGTFRPGNEITRGQIAKVVSNSAGINDDPGPQLFEDADASQPFYIWINRLANHGFMGGYPCGGEGEPCSGDNKPYFRPSANATRGQLAKIVSNSAGVTGTITGQFYSDLPEDHPFYLWIMRLTQLGVMSGYPCGGQGEPCNSQQWPYFRPFNNVTRGQASKIVGNTFFPSCQLRGHVEH